MKTYDLATATRVPFFFSRHNGRRFAPFPVFSQIVSHFPSYIPLLTPYLPVTLDNPADDYKFLTPSNGPVAALKIKNATTTL